MGAGGEKNRQRKETLLSLASQSPIVEGPMFKQGSSGEGFSKRYFALYDGVLIYYHHQRAYQKEKDSGTVKTCKILKLDGLYLSNLDSPPQGDAKKHAFKLHVPDTFNKRRDIILVTTCKKSKHIWMEMLQQQNPGLLPPASNSEKPTPTYIQRLRSSLLAVPAGYLVSSPASTPPMKRRATIGYKPSHHRTSSIETRHMSFHS